MDYILKAENLTKIYGHHKALDNFFMHIPQGVIYGLVGKNGAGKTTLLRIICGLQEATFGDYSLYGISSRKHEILNARKEMGALHFYHDKNNICDPEIELIPIDYSHTMVNIIYEKYQKK